MIKPAKKKISLLDKPTYGERIRHLRNLKNLTQKNLGILIGERQQLIAILEDNVRYRRNYVNAFVLHKLSQFFGVSIEWLLTGDERFSMTLSNGRHQTTIDQDSNNPVVVGTAYVVEWNEIEYIHKSSDIKNIDGRQTIPMLGHAGPNSFALRLNSNSMASPIPDQQDFRAGDFLLFDPDRQYANGSYILVYQDNMPLFRQLQNDFGTYYLLPLNPNYPTIKLSNIKNIRAVLVTRITMLETLPGVPKPQARKKKRKAIIEENE